MNGLFWTSVLLLGGKSYVDGLEGRCTQGHESVKNTDLSQSPGLFLVGGTEWLRLPGSCVKD